MPGWRGAAGSSTWAEQRVSSAQAALYMTTIPLGLAGITAALDRRRPPTRVIAGLALGIAGVAVLARGGGPHSGTLLDRLALAASGLSWAVGSLIATRGVRPRSAPQATAMQLAAGAVALLLLGAAVGEVPEWSLMQLSARAAGSLLFLTVCGTVLGVGAYVWLLRVTSPAAAGSYVFVNPIIAVALASVVGDDVLSARMLVAAGLVVVPAPWRKVPWLPYDAEYLTHATIVPRHGDPNRPAGARRGRPALQPILYTADRHAA